jgi:hypothetical protein
MKHLVGQSHNGTLAYIDLTQNTAAMKNIARQPHLLTLAGEALGRINLNGLDADIECNMGRPVGYDFVIATTEDDTVFYVRLIGDDVYTRFTRKGTPAATNYLSLRLEPDQDGESYIVRDIWVGRQRPSRPGCDAEATDSASFWNQHAFIFQNQPMQTNTLTKTCPY